MNGLREVKRKRMKRIEGHELGMESGHALQFLFNDATILMVGCEMEGICNTKYPILLVHGTGFRDRKWLGYWGRIPKALENAGARVFYGNQDSWATIEQNAEMLREELQRMIQETKCGKVNIIAHSKGGLEARYLASSLHCHDMIASITTISTPHHGSKTLDKVWKLPKPLIRFASVFVNLWFRLLGDKKPDFYHACEQFSTRYMERFNATNSDMPAVYYQSYATAMKHPFSDILMCVPYVIIKAVEGENDGMVTTGSAQWTNFGGIWRGAAGRGISHCDTVDLRRRSLTKRKSENGISDIRVCYLDIASGLKEKGF